LIKQHSSEIAQCKSQQDRIVSDLAQEHASIVERIRAEYNREMDQLRKQHRIELDLQLHQSRTLMDRMKADHQLALDRMATEHQMTRLRDHDAASAERSLAVASAIQSLHEQLRLEYSTAMQHARKQHEQTMQQLHREIEFWQGEFTRVQQTRLGPGNESAALLAELGVVRDQLQVARKQHLEELLSLRQEFGVKIEELLSHTNEVRVHSIQSSDRSAESLHQAERAAHLNREMLEISEASRARLQQQVEQFIDPQQCQAPSTSNNEPK
jgi:kinesin family protein 4/21/27